MDKVAVFIVHVHVHVHSSCSSCFKNVTLLKQFVSNRELSLKDTRPETVRKFRGTTQPEAGKERVFYGRANDPDVASRITHGVNTKSSLVVCIISYTI